MSRYNNSQFQKPENALKRADELIAVGQSPAALQALHDVVTSKRHKTWQKALENVMMKYVELCVEMKKGRIAKEGLIQYRIICQQVNVASLEEVIKHFLKLASDKAEAAQAQAKDLEDVKDLEEETTPEDLMFSYVSGEKGKDRTDRELVTPWFKFLWETYRTCLDILRNNSKLEALYAMTANKAFQFCSQYKRTTEFRRMCEILRTHLANLNKYRDQRDRPDLTQPESLQLYLESRFEQLKVATELELWQEAFRSVEDIHGLMTLVKKSPKPQMMAVYYAKLTKIFSVSDNHLYHAYAWFKLYTLNKGYNKNQSAQDLSLMASSVLLSTLSVLPYDRKHGATHYELETERERNLRMANLLGFTLDPKRDTREVLSRSALLSEIEAKGITAIVPPEVKELQRLLEDELHPLDLCQRVAPVLEKLKGLGGTLSGSSPVGAIALEEYVPALERLATVRLLQQVSQVYLTIKIEHLAKMVPFMSFTEVEKQIVDAVKYNFLQIRIDYAQGIVHFGAQELESEKIKNHITVMSKRLNRALAMINPPVASEVEARKKERLRGVIQTVEEEHSKVLARKVVIERRKEEQERLLLEQEREEEARKRVAQQKHEEAEAKRLEEESRRREEERIRRDIEEKEEEEARQLLAEAEKRKGKKVKPALGEGGKLDKNQLMQDALSEQIRERQEMERKLQKLSRTMDHLERAKREEEVPMLNEAFKNRQVDDEVYHRDQQRSFLEGHKKAHEADLQEKGRLTKMAVDKATFQGQVMSRRAEEFARLEVERKKRAAARKAQRAVDRDLARRSKYLQLLKEQADRLAREEEEARREEEEERARIEEEERLRRLDDIAAKQRGGGGDRYEPRRGGGDDRYGPPGGGGGGGDRYEPRRGGGGDRYEAPDRGGDRWGGGGGDRDGGGGGRYEPRRGGDDRYGGGGGGGGGGGDRYEPRRGGDDRYGGGPPRDGDGGSGRYEPRRGGDDRYGGPPGRGGGGGRYEPRRGGDDGPPARRGGW